MRRKLWLSVILLLLCVNSITEIAFADSEENIFLNPEHTWVILMEQNHFPFGFTPLPVDFINSERMRDMLLRLGIPDSQILIIKDHLLRSDVEKSLKWLKNNSTEGDTIIFYIATHGDWLRLKLKWNMWFPDVWKGIEKRQRILIVNSCGSAQFIAQLYDDINGIAISTVNQNEFGWWGIEEEGLPIIGDIWTYYFVKAIFAFESDQNGDGMISLEEAFAATTPLVQTYMKEQVFPVEEFAQYFRSPNNQLTLPYPNPKIHDTIFGNFILYRLPTE